MPYKDLAIRKQKMREAYLRRKQNPEWVARENQKCLERARKPEVKERLRLAHKRRWENPEYRKRINGQNSEWQKNNRALSNERVLRWRNKNREKVRAKHRAWSKSPQGRAWYQNRDANRRAVKKATPQELKLIREFTIRIRSKKSVTCYYCGANLPGQLAHLDHIVPITKGGLHKLDNLCVACPSCNQTKINKLLSDWMRLGQQILNL